MSLKTDEELLLSLAQGDNSALDLLFKKHSSKVLNYCLKRGLSHEQAQDLVQIVFTQMYRKKTRYNPAHPALAWLYVITKSELKDYRLRELKYFSENEDSLSQDDEVLPNIERRQMVDQFLSALGDKERQIVQDKFITGLDYDEIAQNLNQSESNIRQIVSRSLRFLRKKYSGGDQ